MELIPNVVNVNIGGRLFTTSRNTLCKDVNSFLGRMFSGEVPLQKDSQGNYFIDRDPEYFQIILNFLRDGELELPEGKFSIRRLKKEVDFYQLSDLEALLIEYERDMYISKSQLGVWVRQHFDVLQFGYQTDQKEHSTIITVLSQILVDRVVPLCNRSFRSTSLSIVLLVLLDLDIQQTRDYQYLLPLPPYRRIEELSKNPQANRNQNLQDQNQLVSESSNLNNNLQQIPEDILDEYLGAKNLPSIRLEFGIYDQEDESASQIANWEWNPKSQLMTDLRLNDFVKFKDLQRAEQGLYNIVQSRSRQPVALQRIPGEIVRNSQEFSSLSTIWKYLYLHTEGIDGGLWRSLCDQGQQQGLRFELNQFKDGTACKFLGPHYCLSLRIPPKQIFSAII